MIRRLSIFALALLGLALSAPPVWAAPDLAGAVIIQEPNGFPPLCNKPCYSVEKSFEVFLDGNPTGPGVCPAGNNTFLYTLTHLGGPGPFVVPDVTQFEVDVVNVGVNVTSAGFIPGPGVSPSATIIDVPNDVVTWDFQAPTLASGQTSDQLFICSPLPPGGVTDTTVSTSGEFSLDAPGTCVGPAEIECDLELDKTCCIPPTAAPGVDNCQGKVLELVFEVVGGTCSDTTNGQEGKAKCTGPDPVPGDFGDVDVVVTKDSNKIAINGEIGGADGVEEGVDGDDIPFGSTFTVTNEVDSNGELKASTKLEVTGPGGTQALTIHTSCSKALSCGDQFGSLKLVTITTTEGGTVDCSTPPVPGTECTEPQGQVGVGCTERPVEIVFEYTGSDCQNPLPQPPDKASCSGDPAGVEPVNVTYTGKDPGKFTLSPSSDIDVGETFAFTATGRDELHSESKFLIDDGVGVVQSLTLHTSCSQPLACGDEFGALKIVEFTQKDGTVVSCDTDPGPLFQDACEVPLAPPTPHCTSKVMELQLAYIGDELGFGCSVTNGQDGKASCTGVADLGSDVDIVITKDPDKVFADPDTDIDPPTMTSVDIVTIFKEEGGVRKELASETKFTATGTGGSQDIVIHTSCSQPLNLGDVFGNFAVVGIDRKDDGFIGLGGEVEYQYKVTNNSTVDAIVDVMDTPFGTIATGETVPGNGGMKTFFVTKTLYASLTNEAVATGMTVTGGSCDMPEDTVDVTVSLPPQGAFDCSDAKPIDELSMVWNDDMQDVCVVAHDGDEQAAVLDTVDNVTFEDVVTIDGMGGSPNDQVWEIFAAGDCNGTLLGTSEFHISCSDSNMNGIEDCGKAQGNGKDDDPLLLNDWLLEGMKGDQALDCTPDPITLPGPSFCGLGFELALLLPGLMWLRRVRRRTASA